MTETSLDNTSPVLSIIVNVYNMRREARRTLQSLTADYQRGVATVEYEVIVVENGSAEPLSERFVASCGPQFTYMYIRDAAPSPIGAINRAARQARGTYLGIMIDGARIVTPGLIRYAVCALRAYRNPFVYTLAWHLGPDVQSNSIPRGYSKSVEDQLPICRLQGRHSSGSMLPIQVV